MDMLRQFVYIPERRGGHTCLLGCQVRSSHHSLSPELPTLVQFSMLSICSLGGVLVHLCLRSRVGCSCGRYKH